MTNYLSNREESTAHGTIRGKYCRCWLSWAIPRNFVGLGTVNIKLPIFIYYFARVLLSDGGAKTNHRKACNSLSNLPTLIELRVIDGKDELQKVLEYRTFHER